MAPVLAAVLLSALPALAGDASNRLQPPEVSTAAVKPPDLSTDTAKPPPPPIVLSECRPAIDARDMFLVEIDGRRIRSDSDLEGVEPRGRRMLAYLVLQQLCSRRPSPVQELAKFYAAPVTLSIERECATTSAPYSWYSWSSRRITHRHAFGCHAEAVGVLYHEMTHPIFKDHWLRGSSFEDLGAYAGEGHDRTIFDPDDGTLLLAMDASTHPTLALDEGFADAAALAFGWKSGFQAGLINPLRHEIRSEAWRRLSWERKQSNEYFVALVLHGFVGPNPAEAARRFNRLVRAGSRRRPRTLQQLLEAVADQDPVEDRPRVDRVLGELNAGWDLEREEILRLRREGR